MLCTVYYSMLLSLVSSLTNTAYTILLNSVNCHSQPLAPEISFVFSVFRFHVLKAICDELHKLHAPSEDKDQLLTVHMQVFVSIVIPYDMLQVTFITKCNV